MGEIFTEERSKVIMILLTYSCNLDCVYCYEHNRTNHSMKIDSTTVRSIIEEEVKNSYKTYKHLIIHFMGGEPLLCFDIIKDTCEWIESKEWPINIILSITTNGTLFSNYKDWFRCHSDILKVVLSVDGNKFMQDVNRSGSSKLIDLDFFIATWPDSKIKMTISPYTVNHVAEGVMYLHKKGVKRIEANLALGPSINWTDNHVKQYRQELRKLISFYLSNPDYTPVSILNIDVSKVVSSFDWRKRCSCGEDFVCYDVDGKIYPCHLFTLITLSPNEMDQYKRLNFNFKDRSLFGSKQCEKCIIRRCCNRCPGMNYLYTGTLNITPPIFCIISQIEFLSTCTLLHNKILLKQSIPNKEIIANVLNIINAAINNKKE